MADFSTFVKIIFQNKTLRRLWILPSNHFIRQIIVNSNKGFCAQSLIGNVINGLQTCWKSHYFFLCVWNVLIWSFSSVQFLLVPELHSEPQSSPDDPKVSPCATNKLQVSSSVLDPTGHHVWYNMPRYKYRKTGSELSWRSWQGSHRYEL